MPYGYDSYEQMETKEQMSQELLFSVYTKLKKKGKDQRC